MLKGQKINTKIKEGKCMEEPLYVSEITCMERHAGMSEERLAFHQ